MDAPAIYPTAYFQGLFVEFQQAKLSLASSPVLYGLSTYTVCPVFRAQSGQLNLFRLKDHFQRLQQSARILGLDSFIQDWDYVRFEQTMSHLVSLNRPIDDALLRISVYVDALLGGTKMLGLPVNLAAFVYPASSLLPVTGASLIVSSWRRTSDNAIPARAKVNGGYVNAALMKNEALLAGADDAVALDDQGRVTECTIANIFLIRNNCLVTPGVDNDILEGITRDTVLKLADDAGISSCERNVNRSELYVADEVFLSGSSVRLSPVSQIDRRQIGNGRPGRITRRLQEAYDQIGRGRNQRYAGWLTPAALRL